MSEARSFDVVLLDRDGVVNHDRPDCVRSWDEFELIPGSVEASARLARAGKSVTVITNQSCIGRGWVARETLDDMHARFAKLVADAGGEISGFYVCPHAPDEGCHCRKPRPGLFEQALSERAYEAGRCVLIADAARDLVAAAAAGIASILVETGKGEKTKRAIAAGDCPAPLIVVADLAAAADWLLGKSA